MASYAKLSAEIEEQAGMVSEFNKKLRRLKELTSHGQSRGTASQIKTEYENTFKLSKEILKTFRNSTPNRTQKPQFEKLKKEASKIKVVVFLNLLIALNN